MVTIHSIEEMLNYYMTAFGKMQRTPYTAQTFMRRSWCPSTAALSNAA